MNSGRVRIDDILSCAVCMVKYSSRNLPKVLPCGKTLCESCLSEQIESYAANGAGAHHHALKRSNSTSGRQTSTSIRCKYCLEEHRVPKNGFPTNDVLVNVITTDRSARSRPLSPSKSPATKVASTGDVQRSTSSESYKHMNAILSEIELNSNDLDASIDASKDTLNSHFDAIQREINTRTEKAISDLNRCRDNLTKELAMHKANALEFLNEGTDGKSSISVFKKETKRNYKQLLEASKMSSLDENAVKSIISLAQEINDRLIRTRIYFENCVRSDLQLGKPKATVDAALIGKLEFKKSKLFDSCSSVSQSSYRSQIASASAGLLTATGKSDALKAHHDLSRLKTVNYKLPVNCKNSLLTVLANKMYVKASEVAVIDDYSYNINLALINGEGTTVRKETENINTFRLKKLQSSGYNNNFVLVLVNKFANNSNCLKLYDGELRCQKTIELNYLPIDVFMNDSGIYIKSGSANSQLIHKYDYTLAHVRAFGQASDENKPYFISRYHQLAFFQNEKLFVKDVENSRLRIMSETTGKYVKSIKLNDSKYCLVHVDPLERITIVNKKYFHLSVYNWDGMLLHQKAIDQQIEFIDNFFVLKEGIYVIQDKKNRLIHTF